MAKAILVLVLSAFLAITEAANAQSIPKDRVDWWRHHAPTCTSSDGFIYPAKNEHGSCSDGDMTLFAGLLCAAGESIGCETVKKSQIESGRWFRSPRRAQASNLGDPNSFSPDMALGAQLYVATTRDTFAFMRWLSWMDANRACWIGTGGDCYRGPFLRFCTDDTASGCTVRPGDAASLDATVKFLNVTPPTDDMRRLLLQAGINMYDMLWASAQLNKPGYSQHLAGVQILLLRKMGYSDPRLDTAAFTLAEKQPRNPFFAYLNEGRSAHVRQLTIDLCPSPKVGVPVEMGQWAWEREDAEKAWQQSMLWDCIFMAGLLGDKS